MGIHEPDAKARLDSLARGFAALHAEGLEIGSAVAVHGEDGALLSLAEGVTAKGGAPSWDRATLVPVYSAGKGPASLAMLHALAGEGLDPDRPVALVWPGLPGQLSFAQVLSHQAGLAVLDEKAPVHDHEAVVAALERQVPQWGPPEHGYHPRTFGYLVDELVRRVTGAPSLGSYWREAIAGPLAIDVWFGLPESEQGRVAELSPGRAEVPPGEEAFYKAFSEPGSPVQRAFASPEGLAGIRAMNEKRSLEAGWPGFGAVASADGLARFYALCAAGAWPQVPREWMTERRVDGADRILLARTSFSCGFMMNPLTPETAVRRTLLGLNADAFGHPGAGGSLAFADPGTGWGFAYVMNRTGLGVLPHGRAARLVRAMYLPS